MSLPRAYVSALALLANERRLVALLVLANLALAIVQLAEPVLFGAVVDALARGGRPLPLIGLWAVLGFVGIGASVLVALQADRLAHRQRTQAMAAAFERAMTLPSSHHEQVGTGRVLGTMLAGTDALFWLWLGFFREHLAAAIGLVLLVPAALALDRQLAGILGLLAALYLVLSVTVVRRTQAGQQEAERHHRELLGRVGDVLGNVTVVQSFARLADEASALRRQMGQLLAAQYPVLGWWAILTISTRAAATVVMVSILAAGALLAARGRISVGEIVSFVGFANLLVGRLDQLAALIGRFFAQAPAVRAFLELLSSTGGIVEAPGAGTLGPVAGRVAFEGACYRFPGTQDGVVDLSFVAEPGTTVALVGATGAGKTTALALLQRLRDLDRGRITIDGIDIREVTLTSLRHAMAVVFQDAGLFNRSIRDNLLVGKPDATEAELVHVATLAQAHGFIARKPGGYDFVIGERGQALSGGERQRLAIARALLKDAPILLLDEATSALDTMTEARIRRALDAARAGRTTLVIAHRLSTIEDADWIVVLDRGRIVEQGRHEVLARAGGTFARLLREGGFADTH